jgi:probable F420-dependent oxidoreductase
VRTVRIETLLPGTEPNVSMGASGVGVNPLATFAEMARRIEEWGFDGLTTPETGHDPFLPLATAAEHTKRITLGTNVAIAFPRSPMVVAQMAWDLQAWSGGRLKLGLGTQVKGHNERRYSAPWTAPAGPRMRDYVLCLRAIFQTFGSGAPTFFNGEHYRFSLMTPFFSPGPSGQPAPPIYISALNTYMARLAGELCDGLRLHPLATPAYTRDVILPAIAAGAKKAGRSVDEIEVIPMPFVITGRTPAEVETAKTATRLHIAFYASTRTYHAVLRFHGWEEAGQQLHGLSLQGNWPEMGKLITDEMLEEFAVIGTYDEVGPKIRERWGDISRAVFVPLPQGAQPDEIEAIVDAVH